MTSVKTRNIAIVLFIALAIYGFVMIGINAHGAIDTWQDWKHMLMTFAGSFGALFAYYGRRN